MSVDVRMPKNIHMYACDLENIHKEMGLMKVVRCQQKNQVSSTTSAPLVVVTARLHAARQNGHTDTVD